MVNKVKFSMIKSISLAMLAFAFSNTANAVQNLETSNSLEDVNKYVNEGLPGINVDQRPLPSVPDGLDYSYEYEKTSDGISFEAYQTYGYSSDWSEFVNTTPKDVKLIDLEAGLNAGINLGCSGLNLVEEAKFKFDASEFMDALKNYATTQMAVEALAQIYATPLISTVMDGIKSMNNFVAEFSQASCNMQDVQSRAGEIANARFEECIAENQLQGKDKNSSLVQDKCGPSEITRKIQEFQCKMSTRMSTGTSLSKLFPDMYTDDTNVGLNISKGRLMSMFIPDVKVSVNGGSAGGADDSRQAGAKKPLEDVQNSAENSSYNFIYGLYDDIMESFREENIQSDKVQRKIIEKMDMYKQAMLKYSGPAVYEDSNAQDFYSADKIKDIKNEHFNRNSRHAYRSTYSKTELDEFVIGPKYGVDSNSMATITSDLKGSYAEKFLNLGQTCFAKVNLNANVYTWKQRHESTSAVFGDAGFTESTPEGIAAEMIDEVSECVVMDIVDLNLLRDMHSTSSTVTKSYIKYLATDAAYKATTLIARAIDENISMAAQSSKAMLLQKCKDTPGFLSLADNKTAVKGGSDYGSMCQTPVTDSEGNAISGETYGSCEEYAEDNQLSAESIEALKLAIDDNTRKLDMLEKDVERAREQFNTNYSLYMSSTN